MFLSHICMALKGLGTFVFPLKALVCTINAMWVKFYG